MRTAVPGTFSVRSFVASSPSMPGMRTSMITTSGRRRSARATALAPSEASPTMRMCGARESERRSPSRTTSWSSTIRHVISSGTARSLPPKSHAQGELLRLRRGLERRFAAVSDPVARLQVGDSPPHRLRLRGRQVGPAPVEVLVALELLGPVARKALEEMLARPRAQEEDVAPEMRRARLARGPHDLRQLLRAVGDPGQDRRHADAGA